jgi:hypothetical protein
MCPGVVMDTIRTNHSVSVSFMRRTVLEVHLERPSRGAIIHAFNIDDILVGVHERSWNRLQ